MINHLRGQPSETPWIEFKVNNSDPEMIGKYLSALPNAARIEGEDVAYIVWGIQNDSHAVVGTKFDPDAATVGNLMLPLWLASGLQPSVAFSFRRVNHPDGPVV